MWAGFLDQELWFPAHPRARARRTLRSGGTALQRARPPDRAAPSARRTGEAAGQDADALHELGREVPSCARYAKRRRSLSRHAVATVASVAGSTAGPVPGYGTVAAPTALTRR